MQIARTIVWTLLTAIVGLFVAMNWGESHDVVFWPGPEGSKLLFEWPIGFIALFFFLLGFVPMWLVNRAISWRLTRRIGHLEEVTRVATMVRAEPDPAPAPAPTPAQTPAQAPPPTQETDPNLRSE